MLEGLGFVCAYLLAVGLGFAWASRPPGDAEPEDECEE